MLILTLSGIMRIHVFNAVILLRNLNQSLVHEATSLPEASSRFGPWIYALLLETLYGSDIKIKRAN